MSALCQYIRTDAANIECPACQHRRAWTRTDTLPKRNCTVALSAQASRETAVCTHRGAAIRDERCKLCGGRERLETVYVCEIHGECSARKYRDDGKGPATCNTCKDYHVPDDAERLRKPATVLLSFAHGLGDAVQFTTVLRHLRAHRPELTIDLETYADRRAMFQGLVREAYALGKAPDAGYDVRYSVPWHEPVRVYPDSPGTKIERCLREYPFNQEPDPAMSRYVLRVSDRGRERAKRFAAEVGKFALVHNAGVTAGSQAVAAGKPDQKNMPPTVLEAAIERLKAHGLVPVILDWDGQNQCPHISGVVRPGKGHWLWEGDCLADPCTLAAMSQEASFCLGVDSGPGHIFGAEDAQYHRPGTPTVIVWVGAHPLNYMPPAPHVLHVIRSDKLETVRGDWVDGRDYFRANYNHLAVESLMRGVADAIDRMFDPPSYGLTTAADVTLRHWITDLCQPNPAHAHLPGQPHNRPAGFDLLFRLASERFVNPTIVETGCVRAPHDWQGAGNFGVIAARFVKEAGGQFHTVDNDAGHCAFARACLRPFGECVTVHESDSVAWLAGGREPIDCLYLDSLDTYEPNHAEHCLAELQAAMPRLHAKSLVCIDDTPRHPDGTRFGKGTLALPWLIENNFRILHDGYQILASRT